MSFEKLIEEAPKPAILHWGQNHFIVLLPQKRGFFSKPKNITIADPAKGIITISKELFLQKWISDKNEDGESSGIALILEPGQNFYNANYGHDFNELTTNHANQLWGYIKPHKKLVFQLFLGVMLGSLLQLVFPFLTQSVVDVGINTQNIQFVYIVLLAQLALFIGRLAYFDSKKTSTFENQQLYAIKLMRSPSFSG